MDEPQQPEPIETPATPEQPSTGRPRWRRYGLRLLALVVAVIAGAFVTIFTVDLGPNLRGIAERQGSKYLERPLHIGKVSAKLTPGVFYVEDVVIEGLAPTDRPFLKAKRIEVVLPWWTIFNRKLIVESVEMTDWDMVVETWPSSPGFPRGRHNFPKFTRDSKSNGPKRFTTTLRSVLASRGSFTYEDHGTPWSTAARDLRVSMTRGPADVLYRGSATFSDSTIAILRYLPFRANMRSRFTIDGSHLHFPRIDLISDGAQSVLQGDIDLAHWPEQTYQIRSKIDFPTQKNIFFHGDKFGASGQGDFQGTFHLFKGGRELKGTFTSPVGRERVAVPGSARLGAVGAGPAGGHQRDEQAVRRHRALRLRDGAARREDRAGAGQMGRHLPRCRSPHAHRLPRDAGAAARRAHLRAQPPRVATREVVREAWRR